MQGEMIIYNEKEFKEFEHSLIVQCAPVIAGVKAADVLEVKKKQKEWVFDLFQNSSLDVKLLHENEKEISFLLYRKELLKKNLSEATNITAMKEFGYFRIDINRILDEIAEKYADYKNGTGEYPYEMWIILGRPFGDIMGYLENQGENYLYEGHWKVYGNISNAKKIFESYETAKKSMTTLLVDGVHVDAILAQS